MGKGQTIRICSECGFEYFARRRDGKFCSNACRKKDQYRRMKVAPQAQEDGHHESEQQ